MRVEFVAGLGKARIAIQIDVGFGDAVTPSPMPVSFPAILDHTRPVRTYPRETVIAEKLDAMVTLGITNSRLKDFFDLHVGDTHFTFDGEVLADTIGATFERRGTGLPVTPPVADLPRADPCVAHTDTRPAETRGT